MFETFLTTIRPLINVTELERAAGIPPKTLTKYFSGHQPLPEKHIPAIVRALCLKFGMVEISGWKITADPDAPLFFTSRAIPERDVKITEPQPGVFEYQVDEYRQVHDAWDLIALFDGK